MIAKMVSNKIVFVFLIIFIKKSNLGMYVQFIANAVTFLFGFVVNFVRDYPPFQPVAALGGLLYASGIVTSLIVIKSIYK